MGSMNTLRNEDLKLLDYFAKTRNIADKTKKLYEIALSEYVAYYNTTLNRLLTEAENEEEKAIRWKHRTLKKRLMEYRVHLYNKHAVNTAKHRFTRIQTFYKQFDIEIHQLPVFNIKTETQVINYKNLPDKEIIREALNIASPVMKPLLLFMASSGCAKRETLNLTIGSYIKATSDYHRSNDIYEIIDLLNDIDDVVPTFHILRQKTKKYYTTFCSPEAVSAINTYLLSRKQKLTPESKLFKINDDYFQLKFAEINDELQLGKVGSFNRFRSHMIRKFHASSLMNDGMSRELVNDLQGRTKNSVDDAYFFNSDESLREEYIEHLHAVTIMEDVTKVTVKSPEVRLIESKNKELLFENRSLRSEVDSISKRQDNLERILLDGVSGDELRKLDKLL